MLCRLPPRFPLNFGIDKSFSESRMNVCIFDFVDQRKERRNDAKFCTWLELCKDTCWSWLVETTDLKDLFGPGLRATSIHIDKSIVKGFEASTSEVDPYLLSFTSDGFSVKFLPKRLCRILKFGTK